MINRILLLENLLPTGESMENKIKEKILEVFGHQFLESIEKRGESYLISYLSTNLTLSETTEIEKKLYAVVSSLGISEDLILLMAKNPQKATRETHDQQTQSQTAAPNMPIKRKIDGVKEVVLISSAKGGVGKSTLTVNLALALSSLGKKVGVLDADIYGPSIPLMLDRKDARPLVTEDNKIIPIKSYNLEIMSLGFFMNDGDPVIWRGPILSGAMKQFLFDVKWSDLDFLLIDMPPGTGDVQISIAQNLLVDQAILVSTPQRVALSDTIKGMNMFKKLEIPIKGIVENMSSFFCDECGKEHKIFGEGGVERVSKEANIDLLASIPLVPQIQYSSDEGRPIQVTEDGKYDFVVAKYLELAKKLL